MSEYQLRNVYQTSLDRAGLAIGFAGLIGAALSVVLTVAGGHAAPLAILAAIVLGWLLSVLAITAVGAPIWLVMHVNGRRGPGHAMLIGGVIGFLLLLFGQTYGFGFADAPPIDPRTLLFRWASAAATSLIFAAITAATGYAMWRIAYRRVG